MGRHQGFKLGIGGASYGGSNAFARCGAVRTDVRRRRKSERVRGYMVCVIMVTLLKGSVVHQRSCNEERMANWLHMKYGVEFETNA
jgi:hypothetical protein